jgi:hypothetical protein
VGDHPDAQAEGEAPGSLSAGDGALWLWYEKQTGFAPVPIGVYDHPPDTEVPSTVKAIQITWPGQQVGVIDGAGLRALVQTTRLNDWLHRRIADLIDLL